MDAEVRKVTKDLMKVCLEDAKELLSELGTYTTDDVPMMAYTLYMSRWELLMEEEKRMPTKEEVEAVREYFRDKFTG